MVSLLAAFAWVVALLAIAVAATIPAMLIWMFFSSPPLPGDERPSVFGAVILAIVAALSLIVGSLVGRLVRPLGTDRRSRILPVAVAALVWVCALLWWAWVPAGEMGWDRFFGPAIFGLLFLAGEIIPLWRQRLAPNNGIERTPSALD